MTIVEALILGIVQGITEFLPISSSGHLVLGETLLGLKVEELKSFDVVVHLGSLMAIFVYFRRDIWGLLKSFFGIFVGKFDKSDPFLKLILFILIGTIPAVVVGFTLEDQIDAFFRSPERVALCMIVVGIVFVVSELRRKKLITEGLNWWKAIIIGIAQAAALIPGVSRSGSTIAAGLFSGMKREAAARFSFLLGMPAIFGAGLLTATKIPESGGLSVNYLPLLIGFASSFVFGLISVSFLMRFLKRHTLMVFALYLISLGLFVLSFNFM
ncbi:undecaprenyl-diphosphatase UppP [Candidatus Peregrinibacteria bacterium]|nr:undecaprenyl-diphosphatase UppP [Candidatus Peregrinibacteria bacterium]